MVQYSKGPWRNEHNFGGLIHIMNAAGDTLATVEKHATEFGPHEKKEAKANADLMTDAPVLLDALEQLVLQSRAFVGYGVNTEVFNKAVALLTRHKGEKQTRSYHPH